MSKPIGTLNGGGSADHGAERPTWVRWRMVALLMAFSFMSWFNRVGISVAENPLREEFGFGPPEIGAMETTLLLAYTLCMTPGGWFIDRFGPRRALIVMGFGTAVFVALTGRAGIALAGASWALTSFLIIRAFMGSFSAPIYPASGKLVAHWIPFSRRAWANGLITGSAPLGIAVCHVLFGRLIDGYGWRMAFLITGGCTGLLTLVWTCYGRNYPAQHRSANAAECQLIEAGTAPPVVTIRHTAPLAPAAHRAEAAAGKTEVATTGTGWQLLLRNRSLLLLTLSYAAVGYFEYLFNFCTEAYFQTVLSMSQDETRVSSSISALGQVATMPLGGLISDLCVRRFGYRRGRALVPVCGMLASAATLYAATFTRDHHWTLIWFTLANGAIAATEGAFWSTAIELGGRRGGTSGGIVNTGGNAGGALAPYVTRTVAHEFNNWHLGMYLGSLICLAGVVLWWWIDPSERVEEKGNVLPRELG